LIIKIKNKIKTTIIESRIFMRRESTQTKEMVVTFKDLLHKQLGGNKNPSEEEVREAIKQLKDVGKISALLPLVMLPGSVLTIPILVKIGKKFNIDILPT